MLDRRLLLVSGKGGVGKSAVTAALALAAARCGRRVLALGMTDRFGLAIHLGVGGLDPRPRRTTDGVEAAVVDRRHALDEYLRLQLRIPGAAPTRRLARALEVLVDTAPGIGEIISMGKPLHESGRSEWDLVVADAPPLGELTSYLRAPAVVADLVPTGRVARQARLMATRLADPEWSGLVLVAVPEELPVNETREVVTELATEPVIDVAATVANRVLPGLDVSEATVRSLPEGTPIRGAAELHRTLHTQQRRWLSALDTPVRLPHLFGLLTPAEVAARLSDRWTGG